MAGSKDIDSLKFSIILDSKKFETDMKRVEDLAKKFEESVSHALAITNLLDAAQNKGSKEKVKTQCDDGMEPVYAGKEVDTFTLKDESSFIHFLPESFQQCAKEELYRSTEKLIYRFIAKYPIVAYDNRQRLCLNSANVLIPSVDGMSVKTVAVLLNSSLYRYYYSLKFSDIKVLKGNLQQLPFPQLTPEQDKLLSSLVDDILVDGSNSQKLSAVDNAVYDLFHISIEERSYINLKLNREEEALGYALFASQIDPDDELVGEYEKLLKNYGK